MSRPSTMRWMLAVLLAGVWLVPMLTPAHAVTYAEVRSCNDVRCANRLILEAQHTIRWFHMHDRSTLSARVTEKQRRWERVASAIIRDHQWVIQVETKKIARLRAAQRAAQEPAHLAGWLCIHNGRHPGVPGDPHEGRGYGGGGLYTGPLQMSRRWGGFSVNDWNTVPDMQVYADAEAVAAAHQFSYLWMGHQWPNTYPPCADLF